MTITVIRSSRGFTLVEVLSSLLLLTVTIVATTSLIQNGIMVSRMNYTDTIARAAAIRELERLKTLPWDDADANSLNNISSLPASFPITLPDVNGNGVWDVADPAVGGISGVTGRVYCAQSDANNDGVLDPDIRQITVSVSVYASNPLTNLLAPFFEDTAYAGGGGGGGGTVSMRSVWRFSTFITKNGLNQ